ncbi:MAG: hypothetical protein ACRDHN_13020 [Thermomicrobiales bacterium]
MSTTRATSRDFSQVPSVLDPFLVEFLGVFPTLSEGFSTLGHARSVASMLSFDPAFVEALFTSAQRRSLVEPFYPPGRKGSFRWRLSKRGEQFMNAHIAAAK